jgi:hypothetical protein
MQRFVLQQNIARFQTLLGREMDARSCATLQLLLSSAQRDLSLLDAEREGAGLPRLDILGGRADHSSRRVRDFTTVFESAKENYLLLDPGPGLHIVDVNEAYELATMVRRSNVAGERLFDVFPDNPDDPQASGVSNLYQSLRVVGETGQPHYMDIQQYDVRGPDGSFVPRFWRPVNTPIFSSAHKLMFILHHVEDVTAEMTRRPAT